MPVHYSINKKEGNAEKTPQKRSLAQRRKKGV